MPVAPSQPRFTSSHVPDLSLTARHRSQAYTYHTTSWYLGYVLEGLIGSPMSERPFGAIPGRKQIHQD